MNLNIIITELLAFRYGVFQIVGRSGPVDHLKPSNAIFHVFSSIIYRIPNRAFKDPQGALYVFEHLISWRSHLMRLNAESMFGMDERG